MARGKSAAVEFHPGAMRPAQVPDSTVEILTGEPIGKISPDLYGHFVEHLGGVGYDDIWVDKDAKVSNIGGVRKEFVEHMRRIKASVVRWPGGCFADSYDWSRRCRVARVTSPAHQFLAG